MVVLLLLQCVTQLVAAGADVNKSAAPPAPPPLAVAAMRGQTEILQILLGASQSNLLALLV